MKEFLWYLASPYSYHGAATQEENDRIQRIRFEQVSKDALDLMKMGLRLFVPISHTHPISLYGEGKSSTDYDFWLSQDWPIFDRTDGIIIDMIPGWDESHGIKEEIKRGVSQGKLIAYYRPEVIRPELLTMGGYDIPWLNIDPGNIPIWDGVPDDYLNLTVDEVAAKWGIGG